MSYFPYNPELAGAVVTRFAQVAGGGIDKLKIVKLVYLLDRTAIIEEGFAIVGGKYVSMPHGPVISNFLDDLNRKRWQGINLRDNWVSLVGQGESLVLISEWVDELILRVYEQYGKMAPGDLIHLLHRSCEEWKDPGKSSQPILFQSIPGCDAVVVEAYARELEMMAKL